MMWKKWIKLQKILRNHVFRNTFFRWGVAASTEHTAVFDHLHEKKFAFIADIGANRGQFALIARYYFPDALIHSFEPLKEPAEQFRTLFNEDHKIFLHECALGSAAGRMEIHVSKRDDSSSLLPISDLQSSIFPGTDEKETRMIEIQSLDEIIKKSDINTPALMKIDVQGAELEVLKGCASMLPMFDFVYVECSFTELYVGQSLAHEVITYMNEKGFFFSGIYNLEVSKQGIPIQGDFLFEKKK